MSAPFFSITIASYNMAETLSAALRSALSQSFPSFEILVLDDGSVDATQTVLEPFKKNPNVRIFKHHSRQGLTETRNRLLKEARGEWLSILDADDLLLPNKLEVHYKTLSHHRDVGMIWGRCVVKDLVTGGIDVLPASEYRPQWDLIENYQAVHSATSWRKEALLSVGGYDPAHTLVEDADMYLKIGDHFSQHYSSALVAVKFRNSKNVFRGSDRDVERHTLTRKLFNKTIERRYAVTSLA